MRFLFLLTISDVLAICTFLPLISSLSISEEDHSTHSNALRKRNLNADKQKMASFKDSFVHKYTLDQQLRVQANISLESLPIENFKLNAFTFTGYSPLIFSSLPEVMSEFMTLSTFIKTSSVSVDIVTMGRSACCYNNEFMFGIDAFGYPTFTDYSDSLSTCLSGSANVKVNTGKRIHVAFVKNSGTCTFYVNGNSAGTVSSSCNGLFNNIANSFLTVGGDSRDHNQYLFGSVDNLFIYSSALLPAQILELYTNAMSSTALPSRAPTARNPSATARPSNGKGTWATISNPSATGIWCPKLLTDGSVLLITYGQAVWKLTPDIYGNYKSGTWSQMASLPGNYGPLYGASAVLPDGRVILQGGEYNSPSARQITGAVYDPKTNAWTSLNAPDFLWGTGGANIIDVSSVVLSDGRFVLQGPSSNAAILDSQTLTWSELVLPGKSGGTGNEEGWNLLPDGTVLSVSTQTSCTSEILIPVSNTPWKYAGNTIVNLYSQGEIGPSVLLPDGRVLAIGVLGNSAIYDTNTKAWTQGPTIPLSPLGFQCHIADGPCALLPNGNVLVPCNGGDSSQDATYGSGPVFWYEFDGDKFILNDNPSPAQGANWVLALIVLPTGQVLQTSLSSNIDIYTPANVKGYKEEWRPVITDAPSIIMPGEFYVVKGILFNGWSQAGMYGDDFQGATNYPLVRVTNKATNRVYYCRTFDHSSMAVASQAPVFTNFAVPASIQAGNSTLEVVVNGIPSLALSITVGVVASKSPTKAPTKSPTSSPSSARPSTRRPSFIPTVSPSNSPANIPSANPTKTPSVKPTSFPTKPTVTPSTRAPLQPTASTSSPSNAPFFVPIFNLATTTVFTGANSLYYSSVSQQLSTYLTLALYVQTTGVSSTLITLGRSSSNFANEFMFKIGANGYLSFEDFSASAYGFSGISTVKVNTGIRTHVAFVKNGLTGTFYVNGVASGTITSSASVTYKTTDLSIGKDIRDNNQIFTGSMDNIQIFSSALIASQVAYLYNVKKVA